MAFKSQVLSGLQKGLLCGEALTHREGPRMLRGSLTPSLVRFLSICLKCKMYTCTHTHIHTYPSTHIPPYIPTQIILHTCLHI